jgi:hypothetical protein
MSGVGHGASSPYSLKTGMEAALSRAAVDVGMGKSGIREMCKF